MAMSPESGYTTPSQRMTVGAVTFAPTAAPPHHLPPTSTPVLVTAGEELKWLDGALGDYHSLLRALEQKLEPVLTPPGPDGDTSGKAVGCTSPLVEKLRDDRASVEAANRTLSRLIDRIEL